ncbi:hypothetical protein EES39_37885 [Streptomyces sp. ADI92-24]|uniref:hypothetical protein n=1 Tax=Streptomyces sp. ADI92-24 TaxID=1522756 RepID=UPI000F551B6C|nr:hypothetical protein [Streptomyces sp. ADI92-24]RPK32946.1 hypothetical protein EES39_37885 [Streptomyces sp. ADI92-24]
MSHASATATLSARVTEAAPARPLLVVERLDHSLGTTALFSLCAIPIPAHSPSTTASVTLDGEAVAGTWI